MVMMIIHSVIVIAMCQLKEENEVAFDFNYM